MQENLPTCPCGHDRYHHWARAKLRYGAMGWFNFFNGISAQPKEITFSCGKCGAVFEVTSKDGVMREFRRYPDVRREQ